MLRMKKVGRGFWLVRPDYLSFKATLNPRQLEFGPILQALFTPRSFFMEMSEDSNLFPFC